jgi:hypothetical protein
VLRARSNAAKVRVGHEAANGRNVTQPASREGWK